MPDPQKQVFARATPEVLGWVEYLQGRWAGAASQPTKSEVVREALRRAVAAEKVAERKTEKKSAVKT